MTGRGRLAIAGLAGLGLVACGPSGDPLHINYVLSAGPEQACLDQAGDPITDCNDIPMNCDSVALLRIVDPDDPKKVYVDQCVDIPNTRPDHNLCALAQAAFDLSATFPTDRVEVQLAIYPRSGLTTDPDGDIVCPAQIDFTATGFIAPSNSATPALAGVAYATGYDSDVTIELGCNDRSLIDSETCRNANALDITATVTDFDTKVSVAVDTATNLSVRVGEPELKNLEWIFALPMTVELPLATFNPEPRWQADNITDLTLIDYACLQVLEFTPRATPSLTCQALSGPAPKMLDLAGVRVERSTLQQVLDAATASEFPDAGLVLGVVVDFTGSPVVGVTVADTAGSTIQYLSADRTMVGGTATTASGIFLSTNAPFDADGGPNQWTTTGTTLVQHTIPVGGLVRNQLTVIVIQLDLQTM